MLLWCIFLLLIAQIHGFEQYLTCEDNWHLYGNHCYFLSEKGETFSDSVRQCSVLSKPQLGDDSNPPRLTALASVLDAGELNFLLAHISLNLDVPKAPFFVGLQKPVKQKIPSWVDGQEFSKFLFKNDFRALRKEHLCYGLGQSGFTEILCGAKARYICKRAADDSNYQNSISKCSMANSREFNGSCYFIPSTKDIQKNADEICADVFPTAFVATFPSRAEVNFAFAFLYESKHKSVWAGLHFKHQQLFQWTTTRLFVEKMDSFQEVADEFPWRSLDSEGCINIILEGGEVYFQITPCSELHSPLCMIKVPSDYETLSPIYPVKSAPLTRYFWESRFKETFSNSKMYCSRFGGKLATFPSRESMEKFKNQIQSKDKTFFVGLHIGSHLNQNDSHYKGTRWDSGAPLEQSLFGSNFSRYPEDRCGVMTVDNKLEYAYCNSPHYFVCEIKRETTVATRTGEQQLPTFPKNTPCTRGGGWLFFNKDCYKVFDYPRGTKADSETRCDLEEAKLVSILTKEENDFLLKLLSEDGESSRRLWIGLVPGATNGPYLWNTKEQVQFSNFKSQAHDDSLCVVINRDNGRWERRPCKEQYSYICKAPNGMRAVPKYITRGYVPPSVPPNTTGCIETWAAYGQMCYKPSYSFDEGPETLTWTDAKEYCRNVGSELFSIHGDRENGIVKSQVLQFKDDLWIGLYRIMNGTYMWTDQSRFNYANWPGDKTPLLDNVKTCVAAVYNKGWNAYWDTALCDERKYFICAKPKDPFLDVPSFVIDKCSEDGTWIKEYDRCLKVFYGHQYNRKYNQAKAFCEAQDASLLRITNERLQLRINYLTLELRLPIWIGMKYNDKFIWEDGSPLNYSNWDFKNPDLDKGRIDPDHKAGACVSLTPNYRTWVIDDCWEMNSFICEKNEKRPTVSPPINYYDYVCDPKFSPSKNIFKANQYCYYYETRRLNWEDALISCVSKGGSLISVHSNMLNMKLGLNALQAEYWIGLKRPRDGYYWIDGSEVDYSNMATEFDNTQPCGAFEPATYKWKLYNCFTLRPSICQIPKVHRDTPIPTTESPTTESPTHSPTPDDETCPGMNTAIIVSILDLVLTIIAILGAAVAYFMGVFN